MKKVFVSGCYDLLHSGHVEFFRQASQFGELYVGVLGLIRQSSVISTIRRSIRNRNAFLW